jgi:acyl carrier protein
MEPAEKLRPETEFTVPLLQVVRSLLEEIQAGSAPQIINLDSSLEKDLGLDSLARVELLARIERHFGLALPERVFAEAETPRDLLRELAKASTHKAPIKPVIISPPESTSEIILPVQAQTLVDVLDWHVQAHSQRPHIQFHTDNSDGQSLNYQMLLDGARNLASGLQALGVEPGQTVAIMLPTSEEYFYTFFGILLTGAIPVPIYPPMRPNQLEDHLRRHAAILSNCQAVSMITVAEAKPVARLLKSQLDTLHHIVTVDELMDTGSRYEKPAISPQDTAFLQYTSGSTGSPKGVVLTHANLLANIRAMGERVGANPNDVFVSWLPLYHDMGLIGAWLGSLYYAALFVVMSPLAFLARPQRWFQAIHRYRGTLSAAPNFGYELCLHRLEDSDLEGIDLSSWRAAFNGAEAVSPETVIQFPERFRKYGFRADAMMPVYGLAESSVGLAFPPLKQGVRIDQIQRHAFMLSGKAIPAEEDDTNALRFVACGQPLSGHEIRIADEQGNELPDRQEGRLQFHGPSATSGYLHNHAATEKLFVGDWLDTGDLAYIIEGDLYVTGRTKDIIIRAGRNLYPHELEEAVGNVAEIRKGRVAVFGATDSRTGTERLIVLAETRKKDKAALEQLRKRINEISTELIGGPADDVVLARPNTVLKTSSGKVRRSACRELYELGFIGKTQIPVWRQISRLLITGLMPQARRLRRLFISRLWAHYAQAVFWLLAPITWLVVVISPIRSWRWIEMQYATRLLALLTGCPFRVEGFENLPKSNQPCVYVANHASYLDGPLLIAALKHPFSFVAKAELENQFFAGTFLRSIKAEFVERFDVKKGVEDIHRIAQKANKKRSLFFFPEGTFTRTPGLSSFHLGAFLTAVDAGLPIVPVAIRGTRSILRANTTRPNRGVIRIVIGNPIHMHEFTENEKKDSWTTALTLRDAAREHILRHCGEPDLDRERVTNNQKKPN